jgi:hypothetical protein
MDNEKFTVFYAWQSDSVSRTNRNFIEKAIKTALKNIKKAGSVQASPRLDKDTQGVPGMPDIANTILDKIRSADVFVADISFVGTVPGGDGGVGDITPNPNVMIELGYALNVLGWERILCVLNTDSGPPERLPFDLRNRKWPILYALPAGADSTTRSAQKERLVKGLQSAITEVAKMPPRKKEGKIEDRIEALEKVVSGLSRSSTELVHLLSDLAQASSPAPAPANDPRTQCVQSRSALIERVDSSGFEGISPNQPLIILTICPGSSGAPLPLASKTDMLAMRLRPFYASGWNHRWCGDRFVTYAEEVNEIKAATEITLDGIVNAVDRGMLAVARRFLGRGTPEDVCVIPSIAFEKSTITEVPSYLAALHDLGAKGPWGIAIGLIGLGKSMLSVSPRLSFDARIFEGEMILPPAVEVPDDTDLTDPQAIARVMRPAFDYVWREHNFPQSLDYGETGEWIGHQ